MGDRCGATGVGSMMCSEIRFFRMGTVSFRSIIWRPCRHHKYYQCAPPSIAQGGKISYAVANRAYSGRIMGSYHSGSSEDGWALSLSVARRFAEESYVDGTHL